MGHQKTVEEKKDEGSFNLDWILAELGSFGKYQLLLLFLLAFRDSFLAMCNFNYVFTAAEVKHRCLIPECESTNLEFNASWLHNAMPNETNMCLRHLPVRIFTNESSHEQNISQISLRSAFDNDSCEQISFNKDRLVPCIGRVYENYNSIVSEFDLGCDQWKRTLIGTVHNLGLVFSFVVSGFISDRYGRKVIIVGTPLVVGTCGVLKSFSVNYWMLLILEFFETALGYGNASLVLTLEIVTQNRRVVFSSISDILASVGSAFFGLIAWKIPYWRYMMRTIYSPLLIVVFYIFLIDEGVRWLLAHNKKDEAVRILNKVAKVNNVELSNKAKIMMEKITEERNKVELDKKEVKKPVEYSQIMTVLRSKKILFRVTIIAACFFFSLFVYNGALINSTSISGNKYLNYSLMILVSVPTRMISAYTLTRFGRKAPICVAYGLCAVFFITSAFITKSVWWVPTLLYIMGKMCSSFALFGITVYAMEVFPTTSRNSLTNISNTIGRIGSVLAPQTPLLEYYMAGLASIVFGVVSLVPAILILFLPDSSKVRLPDDVHDAEKLDDDAAIEDKEKEAKRNPA